MKFKVGDKVSFLNESGGGVINKIISPGLVSVTIDEGFDIPVQPSELILNQRAQDTPQKTDVRPEKAGPEPARKHGVEEEIYEERKSKLDRLSFRGDIKDGMYYAFVPHDQKWLVTGEMDIMLVNHTDYEVLFSFFLQDQKGQYEGTDYDVLEPRSKILLETIDRDEIESWNKGLFQFMYHKDKPRNIYLPANCAFDIKPVRIYKEANYKESAFIAEKAFIYSLIELQNLGQYRNTDAEKKFSDEQVQQVKAKEVKPEHFIDKHRVADKLAVVDLHIAELVSNISGLSGGDMLQIQKDYFKKALESALQAGYEKVTFIHGVGNGVLRDEIIKMLKDYENLEKRSASLAKFGVGAIDVIIEH